MTPVFLSLLFLCLTAVPAGAATDGAQTSTSLDVSEVIASANTHMDAGIKFGDIMQVPQSKNAVPCTSQGCTWPKKGKYVTVPYVISNDYSPTEMNFITAVMQGFQAATCIRFIRRRNEVDYIRIFSGSGCWSYLGRVGGEQLVSLDRGGCLQRATTEHEFLHALGFHHEQSRSDRDEHVSILYENIETGRESNFDKVATNNLGTPYDFNSVMQYGKYAFSSNGQPTMVAISDPNLDFGHATQMSSNDIDRINRLYQCCK